MEGYKILYGNYGTAEAPIPVAMGYSFQDRIYNLKDFKAIVEIMNKEGWHYRDRPVSIGGNIYNIAEVYEGSKPLRELIQGDYIQNGDLQAELNKSCLPMDALQIPAHLRTYPVVQQTPQVIEEPVVQVEVQQTQATPITEKADELSKYYQYLTPEEIAPFEPIEDLTEEEFDILEALYEERKGEVLIKELITYELPPSLSNYDLAYRDSVLGKVVNMGEGATQEEKDLILHELGLASVVQAMMTEIPSTLSSDSEGEEFSIEYKYLGVPLQTYLAEDLISVHMTARMEAQSVCTELSKSILGDIRKKYGSYSNFIEKFLEIKAGEDILEPSSVVSSTGITVEYRTVKSYDNLTGFGIGFVADTGQGLYPFPLALFEIVGKLDTKGRFVQKYNALLEPFLKEIGKAGLNIEQLKIDSHDVFPIDCQYLGQTIDSGDTVYMFKINTERERYCVLYSKCLANLMMGSMYVMVGNNFEINYKGEEVVVAPTGEHMTAPQIDALIGQKAGQKDMIIEVYPGYYQLMDMRSTSEVENLRYRKVMDNFKELAGKTWELGYTWNPELGGQTQPSQEQAQITQAQPVVEEGAIDLFAQQPSGVFEQPQVQVEQPIAVEQSIQAPIPTDQPVAQETHALSQPLAQLEELYMNMDDRDKARMLASVNNIISIFSM